MSKFLNAVLVFTLVGAFGCSSGSNTSDAGPTTDSGTPFDAGFDAGPSNFLGGPLAFDVANAVPVWTGYRDGGALNPNAAAALLGTLSRDEMCALAARTANGKSVPLPPMEIIELIASGGSSVTAGAYPIADAGAGHNLGNVLWGQAFADGGITSFAPTAPGPQDGVTITSVTFPTDLGFGYATGGELKGTFDVNLTLGDGGLSHLTGTFDAVGCPDAPLAPF